MRTPEEIYKLMKEEMPWGIVGEKQIRPYIIEAISISQKEMRINMLELLNDLITQNEDDFDRGKGKYILRQFIEEHKNENTSSGNIE